MIEYRSCSPVAPLGPRADLISLEAATPDAVFADPNDDTRLLIHFEGAAEPWLTFGSPQQPEAVACSADGSGT